MIQTVFVPLLGNAQASGQAAQEGPELPIKLPRVTRTHRLAPRPLP